MISLPFRRLKDVQDLAAAILAIGDGRTQLVAVDATGQELGPAYPQVDYVMQADYSVRIDTFIRVVMDVENMVLVACDVRGDDGEILKPLNSDIENSVLWTGPACMGTPFSRGRVGRRQARTAELSRRPEARVVVISL